MKWLDLTTIKAQLRVTDTYEDELLTHYGNVAEETVLDTIGWTYEELIAEYATIPAKIKQASLLLVGISYDYRIPVTRERLNLVPYGNLDMLLKPYMKL